MQWHFRVIPRFQLQAISKKGPALAQKAHPFRLCRSSKTMTIQEWEKAAGKIHEIKGIDAKIAKVKRATTGQEFLDVTLWTSEAREALRAALLQQLQRQRAELEQDLERL